MLGMGWWGPGGVGKVQKDFTLTESMFSDSPVGKCWGCSHSLTHSVLPTAGRRGFTSLPFQMGTGGRDSPQGTGPLC